MSVKAMSVSEPMMEFAISGIAINLIQYVLILRDGEDRLQRNAFDYSSVTTKMSPRQAHSCKVSTKADLRNPLHPLTVLAAVATTQTAQPGFNLTGLNLFA